MKSAIPQRETDEWCRITCRAGSANYFKYKILTADIFFFIQPPKKVCIANQNIGQKFFFLNKYISVILAFVVYFIKLVTSAVGIILPSIFCNGLSPHESPVAQRSSIRTGNRKVLGSTPDRSTWNFFFRI